MLGNNFDEARVKAFLEAAPRMVAFFETNTALQFEGGTKIPDTYGNVPGAGTGGRSVIAAPYDARGLGDLVDRLRLPMRETTFMGMTIQAGADLAAFMNVTRSPPRLHPCGASLRPAPDRPRPVPARHAAAQRHRACRRGCCAPPPISASNCGRPRPRCACSEDSGAVRGAVLGTPEGEVEVRARRGVVLAAGGFPHDPERRRAMFPGRPSGHLTVAAPSATGDGLRLGESAGGRVDDTLAAPGAWCPVSLVPFPDGTVGRFPHIIERNKPGIIGVLADGRRFCNEGNGYHDYVAAMLRAVPPGQEVASWLVCTRAFQRRYGLGIARPTPLPVGPYIRSGYIKIGRTIAELARACGIDPDGLERTVAEYNRARPQGRGPRLRSRLDALQPARR